MARGGVDVFADRLKSIRRKHTRLRTHPSLSTKKVKDKKLKSSLKRHDEKVRDAADRASKVELLFKEPPGYLVAEGSEKTWKISQSCIYEKVDHNTRNNIFNLDLDDFGPYCIDYTREGRNLLIGGKKGHVASIDWKNKTLRSEFHVRETVRDVKWLQNETMYAVAQKKYTYLYDGTGMELHCLRSHIEASALEYLPYHWLLASSGNAGTLVYQDVSTGNVVSEIRTRRGPTSAMAQNKFNSVIHLGHSKGVVTMWSPSVSTPLVKMFCHKAPVLAIGVDISGKYMATTGLDNQLKLWDLRTYKLLNQYHTYSPGTSISLSDMGLLATSLGSSVFIWDSPFTNAQRDPYLTHAQSGSSISAVQFAPYEDVLGIGHRNGFSSIAVPGAGNPNFDSMEANPFRTKKQRQESEVHSLLDKLQPEMIVLDPTLLGTCIPSDPREEALDDAAVNKHTKVKNKTRRKTTAFRRMLGKKSNVIDEKMIKVRQLKETLEEQKKMEEQKRLNPAHGAPKKIDVLDRFKKSHSYVPG